ncbi:MAG: type II toxin-antitoxin system Phd/YefM family antitoxin [Eubacterium sp.]|nr:type II toxin-antitoxin system Phd/YefM family antitoxin [Candidatus Colimonas fimequi]
MEITATEFKTNFGHYIDLVGQEELIITKNGKRVARLVKTEPTIVEKMSGLLASSNQVHDAKDWKNMRLTEKYGEDDND